MDFFDQAVNELRADEERLVAAVDPFVVVLGAQPVAQRSPSNDATRTTVFVPHPLQRADANGDSRRQSAHAPSSRPASVEFEDDTEGAAIRELADRYALRPSRVHARAFVNNHACDGIRNLVLEGADKHAIVRMRSGLVYAVHKVDDVICVAGVPVRDAWNLLAGNVMLHGLAAPLPDVRPVGDELGRLKVCYLVGERIDVRFEVLNAPPSAKLTIVVQFTDPRTNAVGTKTYWPVDAPECVPTSVVVPEVPTGLQSMYWFCLFAEGFAPPILSQRLPWHIEIVPNVQNVSNLRVRDVNPRVARASDVVWIEGAGFGAHTRVQFGDANAMVLDRPTDTLLKCLVPNGAGRVPIYVEHGGVFAKYAAFSYAEGQASAAASSS